NLSTFTAHIANIRRMLELCESPALVLLDEVGTGTDPEEGSALGVAVVDHFRRECGAHVVATTHYSGLKMYAASDEGVVNASVEFDEKTLQPTYKLLVGVAGASSGLEIARRFHIPDEIIDAATARVGESALASADYLRRIKREAEESESLRRALEEERAAVAEKYSSLDAEAARRERERQQLFDRELRSAVTDFERRSQELFAQIEDRAARARVEREAERRAAELRREAQARAAQAKAASAPLAIEGRGGVRVVHRGERDDRQPASAVSAQVAPPAREIRAGDRVRLRTLNSIGVVERLNNGEAEVMIGSLRFREKTANLELIESAPEKDDTSRGAKLQRMAGKSGTEVRLRQSHEEAHAELKVIGQTTDEATDGVDKFLDESYVQGLAQVRIIHGHGTGALRRVIAELLRNHPHVARFNQAPQDQGGAGATIVELKQ
ncbi:MAG: Smr/MutS family protein, partial [Pyrinomonadaceae bacterium]